MLLTCSSPASQLLLLHCRKAAGQFDKVRHYVTGAAENVVAAAKASSSYAEAIGLAVAAGGCTMYFVHTDVAQCYTAVKLDMTKMEINLEKAIGEEVKKALRNDVPRILFEYDNKRVRPCCVGFDKLCIVILGA